MATSSTNGTAIAVAAAKDHLIAGLPLSRMDAMVLFGLSNLPEVVYELKKQGFRFETKKVTYAAVMVRINKHAVLQPPPNLPIRDIFLTDYRITR